MESDPTQASSSDDQTLSFQSGESSPIEAPSSPASEASSSSQFPLEIKPVHSRVRCPFKCYHCGERFPKKSTLMRHSHHRHYCKLYRCDVCGHIFRSKHSLQNHTSLHTSNINPLGCSFCGTIFDTEGALKEHLKLHQCARPFICDYFNCHQAFWSLSLLLTHTAFHTGEAPFCCPVCYKPYYFKVHMDIHMAKHHVFKCRLCYKQFTVADFVTRHMQEMHKEEFLSG